ncbi:MAG: periplasmic heavy metal sensor [Xanthomonadales bacterium]|nr:Spy/CpxP family protein refolding chaperone [Gammaproteobacteria bacterium]NNE06116.1 periplasmic heavy metal sensor [Xanthomonadales bacterium]NNL94803.1 periplasmic heavy metal sensor [Xanthomonadales bacterium]
MKATQILVMTCAVLACSAGAVAGEHDERRGPPKHDRAGIEGVEAVRHLSRAFRRLDLDEEQVAAVRAEMTAMRESLKPLATEFHQNRKSMQELVLDGEYDEQQAAEIAEHQGALTAEIALLTSATVARMLDHLNDEQRAELDAMRADRMAHREEMRDRIRAHRDHRRAYRNKDGDG